MSSKRFDSRNFSLNTIWCSSAVEHLHSAMMLMATCLTVNQVISVRIRVAELKLDTGYRVALTG